MSRKKTLLVTSVALCVLALPPVAIADWEADEGDRLQERAEIAIAKMREKVERSHPYFADAYAIAVWPGITRIAIGFGGSYGKGVVIEQDEAVGTVSHWQLTSGIQGGVKNFAMILFFKDKKALEGLKLGKIQFTGQAGVDVATVGAHGTPTYNEGVAIIPITNVGLMAEFAAAGNFFRYKPYKE